MKWWECWEDECVCVLASVLSVLTLTPLVDMMCDLDLSIF